MQAEIPSRLRNKRRCPEAARTYSLNEKGSVMIYIGNFLHTTNQEQAQEMDRRHGEFTLIVETADAETALHLFREKTPRLSEESGIFSRGSALFF